MPIAIKLWEVTGNILVPVGGDCFPQAKVASVLEEWIEKSPEIVGGRMVIVGRQLAIADVGRLDLLGIDTDGKLVIIELKRDRTHREAIAQALDYASWFSSATNEEIERLATAPC